MKNEEKWVPSKYVYRKGKLIASRNKREVQVGSRLFADINANFFTTIIPQYAKGKLVDLGCGKVPLYETYRKFVTSITCIDWENTLHKNEYLDFECDLNAKIPVSDSSFDTIILSDVLEHIAQPENLWAEMSRILVTGGKVILSVPFYYSLHEIPNDYYRYTEYALTRFAQVAQFKILYLQSVGGAPEVIADVISKLIQRVPVFGTFLAASVQAMTLVFIKTSLGKMISVKSCKQFPFGYFVVAEKAG
jgi:SAM-dependent methyltransferase